MLAYEHFVRCSKQSLPKRYLNEISPSTFVGCPRQGSIMSGMLRSSKRFKLKVPPASLLGKHAPRTMSELSYSDRITLKMKSAHAIEPDKHGLTLKLISSLWRKSLRLSPTSLFAKEFLRQNHPQSKQPHESHCRNNNFHFPSLIQFLVTTFTCSCYMEFSKMLNLCYTFHFLMRVKDK